MDFSLVIPCYNESGNLEKLIERCNALIQKDKNIEVILVDNGSTDNTQQLMQELLLNQTNIRMVRVEKNKGYGFGILFGLNATKGKIVGWTHADLQTDPDDFYRGIQFFKHNEKKMFVKGRRFGRPLMDILFTVAMSIFETFLLSTFFWDINAQPTIFPKEFFEKHLKDAPHDFSLDLYTYFMAKKQGYIVKRFPVFFGERFSGVSHWNINWNEKLKFIKRTINFSMNLRKELKC